MFYQKLKFPKFKNRPFFYTNFVATLDGKVAVKKLGLPAGRQGYWPIGSKIDHQILLELRSYADCLIHGKNLAKEFGEITKKSLKRYHPDLPYIVVTSHNLLDLVSMLQEKGYKKVLVEGGPTLLTSFLKEDLIDEIFLTVSPKIFGSEKDVTLTLTEGYLFPPDKIKKFKLLSVKKAGDEVFLRYRAIGGGSGI